MAKTLRRTDEASGRTEVVRASEVNAARLIKDGWRPTSRGVWRQARKNIEKPALGLCKPRLDRKTREAWYGSALSSHPLIKLVKP